MNDTLRALAIADIKACHVLDGLIGIETEQVIHGCVGATDAKVIGAAPHEGT